MSDKNELKYTLTPTYCFKDDVLKLEEAFTHMNNKVMERFLEVSMREVDKQIVQHLTKEQLFHSSHIKKLVEALKFYADEDRIFLTHGKTLQETLEVSDMQEVAIEALRGWDGLDEE